MLFSFDQKIALKTKLYNLFREMDELPIFMCVGVDSVVIDSLGPIVGEMLKKKYAVPAYVYGDLDYTITAGNIDYVASFISIMHPRAKICVIDASVGNVEERGYIKLVEGGVMPAGLTKQNPKVIGDMALLGVVATHGFRDKISLNNIKMQEVLSMAEVIAWAISQAIAEIDYNENEEVIAKQEYMYI